MKNKHVNSGLLNEIQLFNLKDNIGETNNVAKDHPEIVKELSAKFDSISK